MRTIEPDPGFSGSGIWFFPETESVGRWVTADRKRAGSGDKKGTRLLLLYFKVLLTETYLHVEHDDWPGLEVKKSFLHFVHNVELKQANKQDLITLL